MVRADEASWLTSPLSLTENQTYTLPQDVGVLNSIGTNNIACYNTNFVTQPQKKIGVSIVQFQKTTSVCAYSALLGTYGGGYFLAAGTSVAGKLKSQMSTSSKIIPVPNSRQFIELVSANGGYKILVYENPAAGLRVDKDIYGAITYTLPLPDNLKVLKSIYKTLPS